MTRTEIKKAIDEVALLAGAGKGDRLRAAPGRYLLAGLYNRLLYPYLRLPLPGRVRTAYGAPFRVKLPAATDIYLTGGKTHPSEIRLCRFLLYCLRDGMTYVDVGAHFGFFAGLAATLNPNGRNLAFEPAPSTFKVLQKNMRHLPVTLRPEGLAESSGTLTFYQFPTRYSEYNSLDVEQYAGEAWLAKYPPRPVEVSVTTLDEVLDHAPDLLKIDVEGAEDRVIRGGRKILSAGKTRVVLEFLPAANSNGSHQRAHDLLLEYGYRAYFLDQDGHARACLHPETYLLDAGLDSTNLVYLPPNLIP